MSTIVTRAGKGSALTHAEVDANFTNLNTDKLETSTAASTYAARAGATFTGAVTTAAATTSAANFNIPHGTAPTTPSNGDIWTTNAANGLFFRAAATTFQVVTVAGTQTLTSKTLTSPTLTNPLCNGLRRAVTAQTGTYTATTAVSTILCNATTAAFAVTLPTAVGNTGLIYTIKKTDSSANAVTVGTTSSQTIDGAATFSLPSQWNFVVVTSDGANWMRIG